jgi:RluA family pseudouridine synthase
MKLNIEPLIIHEDEHHLVLNKPHGLPTSGKNLDDPDCLQYHLIKRQGTMTWAIHQLDADTTGINLFCKNKKMVHPLKQTLADPKTEKVYLAIVHNQPTWTEHTETSSIGYIDHRSLGVTPDGKPCHSHFKRLQSSGDFSLIEVRIFTGRTHQIRIHLAHLGHPLVGEEWYRIPPCTVHPRQALHAHQLNMCNGLNFRCPLAPDLDDFCSQNQLY